VGDGWYVSLKQQPVLPFILISSFMQLCVFDADLDVFVFIFFIEKEPKLQNVPLQKIPRFRGPQTKSCAMQIVKPFNLSVLMNSLVNKVAAN
jgi:hypothetical protein